MKIRTDISSAGLAAQAEAMVKLTSEKALLQEEVTSLKQRVAWFEKQLFGQKSEKRPQIDAAQLSLLGDVSAPITGPEGENEHITYTRKKNQKQRPDDCVNDSGLRFSDNVPVKVINIIPDELKGEDADLYEVIGTKSTFRLSQRPASFVVLRFDRQVLKKKDSEAILPSPAPFNVLEKSIADVSFLVGLLVDKFQYHLPLYRQHQRLTDAGITLSRTTLTNAVRRAIDLLYPIADAQLASIPTDFLLSLTSVPNTRPSGAMKFTC